MRRPLVIGYELTSAYGRTIRKVVICDTQEEYLRIKKIIEDSGYPVLTFEAVFRSNEIF